MPPMPPAGAPEHQRDALAADLLATLGHELRTPLAALHVSLELLAEFPTLSPEDVSQLVRHLQRGVGWLEGLVENMSACAAVQSSQLPLNRRTIRLLDSIEFALALVQPFLDRKGQRVRLVSPRPSPVVYGDPQRLGQVLVNLLTNASTYGPWGDAIDLVVSGAGDQLEVRVSDHGAGVPEHERKRIFGRYVRGAGSGERASAHVAGLGLGLHIVKTIVELHGGAVGVDATAQGQGASFWFRLACLPEDGHEAEEIAPVAIQPHSGGAGKGPRRRMSNPIPPEETSTRKQQGTTEGPPEERSR